MNQLVKSVIRHHRPCPLPPKIANMCESGCIYREPAFKHLRCPKVSNLSPCAAPCPPQLCDCKHTVKTNPRKAKNLEVCLQ